MLLMVWFCSFLPFHKLHGRFLRLEEQLLLRQGKQHQQQKQVRRVQSLVTTETKQIRQIIQFRQKWSCCKKARDGNTAADFQWLMQIFQQPLNSSKQIQQFWVLNSPFYHCKTWCYRFNFLLTYSRLNCAFNTKNTSHGSMRWIAGQQPRSSAVD